MIFNDRATQKTVKKRTRGSRGVKEETFGNRLALLGGLCSQMTRDRDRYRKALEAILHDESCMASHIRKIVENALAHQ